MMIDNVDYPEDHIQCIYQCPEDGCEESCGVNPGWHQDNGTPVCPDCDVDMRYLFTTVKPLDNFV